MIDDATPTQLITKTISEPSEDQLTEHPKGLNISVSGHTLNGFEMQVDESDARHEPLKGIVTEHVVEAIASPVEDPQPVVGSVETKQEDSIEENDGLDYPMETPSDAQEDNLDHPMGTPITPVTTPGVQGFSGASNGDSTTNTTPNAAPLDDGEGDDDKPRPAKRPRVHSDADEASIAHPSASPPPTTATSDGPTPVATPSIPAAFNADSRESTLGAAQYKFGLSTVKSLKKLKDARPFTQPVDIVLHNIPHYPTIVKHPMDLSTVERKLNASNPTRPDPNPSNPRYYNADEFVADVRLIFANCYAFNGIDNPVSLMAKRVEEIFDKQVKHMPSAAEVKPTVKRPVSPVSISAPPPKKAPARRQSMTTGPPPRRIESESAMNARPKREIHPPTPRDIPYAEPPRKRKPKRPDDNLIEDLNFCSKVLTELHGKRYKASAVFFYNPVDHVALGIPDYPRLIKKPMDMSTMRRKLDGGEYTAAKQFYDDFKLMIRNCFTYNPSGTPVNTAGQDLQKVFDEKWGSGPPERRSHGRAKGGAESEDDSDQDMDAESERERKRKIQQMEAEMERMASSIAAMKQSKAQAKKPAKVPKERPTPVASTSKPTPKPQPKATTSNAPTKGKPGRKAKKNANAALGDDDTLSFDQKKQLSEAISTLEGTKLEKVINIIHEGMPEIKDSNEEIELEIDLLPPQVLTKLFNFVIRPAMKASQSAAHREIIGGGVKRGTRGKGTGTGGLKRKSMDEDVEAEKIRQLEERMALFDNPDSAAAAAAAPAAHVGGHGSDSSDSSGSDSSGSDSE